jgi:fructuronate reductase
VSTLSLATLDQVPATVTRPAYDPREVTVGIVHFGPGAFHRAHQAWYIDRLLAQDPRWGIAAVSLRSPGTVMALKAQDGLYSISVLDREPATEVIGAHRAYVGPGEEAALHALLASPDVRIVTSTVTEKGYCLSGNGTLDLAHSDIVHDLAAPEHPRSLIGWLVAGLAARREAGTPAFAVLCCDNMASNGDKLRAATIAFAAERDKALADWIAAEVAFPNAMVDSITPATDEAQVARAAAALWMTDDASVQREAFVQWVLQDMALPGSPDLASVGVTLTSDVAAWEQAKLRVLNGAHSTLAYLGLLLGHETVADAMGDADLAAFAETMVREEVLPTLTGTAGLDPQAYAASVFARFRNPAIRHLLSQIAWDGSKKLPYRLLDSVGEQLAAGRSVARLATAVAAWIAFLRRRADTGESVTDPLAVQLRTAVTAGDTAEAIADQVLLQDAVFPPALATNPAFRDAVAGALGALLTGDPRHALHRLETA